MKEFSIKGEHGNLRGAKWLQATNPHSTVQIIHGLAEHHKRYDLTAKALNDEGFQVYCNDHLGHGLHVKDGKLRGYCLLYTSPSPRDKSSSRMPSSA